MNLRDQKRAQKVITYPVDFIARIAEESNKKCLDKKKTKISTQDVKLTLKVRFGVSG